MRKSTVWLIVVLSLVSVPAVLMSNSSKDAMNSFMPETFPFPSTFNKKMSGYSAFYELCQKVGFKCQRWEMPYRELNYQHQGTLVIVTPWQLLTKGDLQYLDRWVKDGNDLVYLDDFSYRTGTDVLHKFGLHARYKSEIKDATVNVISGAKQTNTPFLKLSAQAVFTGGAAVAGGDGAAYLTVVQPGKGQCLIGSTAEMCANKFIADPAYKNNFQFLVNWLQGCKSPIMFDERCHGFSAGENAWYYVLHSPVGYVILQLMLLAVVALISLNQRFGQPLIVSTARRISNLAFIEGLASTYERAHARDAAWAMMYAPFKAKLCKRLGIAPDASLEHLSEAWAQQSGRAQTEIQAFLQRAQDALEKPRMTDQELHQLVNLSVEFREGLF
jgi:hypothetical protein